MDSASPTTTTDAAAAATPHRQIRALYDDTTIAVYKAYAPEIAESAVAAGTFVPPFSLTRMTWIKPSFLWMAYRSGWATKPGQTRVLRIHLTRTGFEWALSHSCLSNYDRKHHASESAWRATLKHSPVRIQWDPNKPSTSIPNPPSAPSKSASPTKPSPSTSTTGSPT